MANKNKVKIVDAAEQSFKNSPCIYFTNYTGMNVVQATELRKSFREKNVKFTVAKNTLNKIAAKNAGIEGLDDIDLTMEKKNQIDSFEKDIKQKRSWLFSYNNV